MGEPDCQRSHKWFTQPSTTCCATSVPVQCYPYNVTEVCEPREEESVLTGDLDCVVSQFCSCIKGSGVIAEFIFEIGPLLYPFSIEFRDMLLQDFHLTFLSPSPSTICE